MSGLALLAGGISFASHLISSSEERNRNRQQQIQDEQQYGRNAAGIDFTTQRKLSMIPSQVKATAEMTNLAKYAVEKEQARTEAEARVNAAAAGVAGASVDTQIADTERTAAENKAILDKNKDEKTKQMQVSIVDMALDAELQKGGLQPGSGGTSRGTDLAIGGLSFLSSYISAL